MLDHGRAAFDPVPAIDVGECAHLPDHGMVDVAADHAIDVVARGLRRECALVLADEIDRVLDL